MKKPAVKTWSTPVSAEKRQTIPCVLCGGVCFKPGLVCEGFSYVRCGACGLVQMNPQPSRDEVYHRYGDGHGEDYLAYEIAHEASFLRLQDLALGDAGFYDLERTLMKRKNPPRLLDIGCATGALLEKLRERGWETEGIEISPPQADYARRRRRLRIRPLPLEENHLPENHCEVVLASHLIEHLNNPASFLEEARRILSPGGRIFITTPNIAGFQARLFGGRWRSAIFDHLYLFSVKTLSALLVQSGFAVERIVTWGGLAAGIAPVPVKACFDRAAKRFGLGDVMLIRGKIAGNRADGNGVVLTGCQKRVIRF
jgi:2-polyprenyl-3-methyl-5-hydroxy-6-metoxy-1,4-benzoquinol methylase